VERKNRGAKAPRIWGGVRGVCGGISPDIFFFNFWFKMRILVHFAALSEYLLLHCNTSRSRPTVRLPTLTL